MTFDAYTEIA